MEKVYTKEYIQSLSEDELRTEVVIPLFRAMQFTVHETHGALEFGKDLIAHSRDNTGETVYSAVQIKTKDIHGTLSSRGNVRTIIQQCESAFQIPFVDAFEAGAPNRYVERIYIVTSGKITKSAETIIANSLKRYGPVKFMDIDRLLGLTQKLLPAKVTESAEMETLPIATSSITRRVFTGCGELYVTYSAQQEVEPFVFAHLAKAGGCASANLESIGYLISLALNKGASIDEVVKKLRGIRCPSIAWEEGKSVLSCSDAIALVLEESLHRPE